MRKEIKSKSKRKWIVGGAMLFGGIALLTTGFATWIVGTQIKQSQQDTNVTVDTVENRSLILTTEVMDSGLHIGEDTLADTESKDYPVNVENGKATDFQIKLKIKITRSTAVELPTKLVISINDNTEHINALKAAGNTVVTNFGVKGVNTDTGHVVGEDYEFVTLTKEYSLKNELWDDTTDEDVWTYYEEATIDLLSWGSFFDSKAPTKYYDELAGRPTDITSNAYQQYVNHAGEELEALNEMFADPTPDNDETGTIIPIKLAFTDPVA